MRPRNGLIRAGVVLGIGLGGFADGIFLHQIIQAHNMLSNRRFPDTLVNAEINMFWDGIFHAFTWVTTLIGLGLLWRALRPTTAPRSGKALVGSMIMGWGIFNLVEGLIDHQLLELHHVIERAPKPAQLYWDFAFLAIGGIGFVLLGLSLVQSAQRQLTKVNKADSHLESVA